MATIVPLQPAPTFGQGLGQGIGNALQMILQRRIEMEQAQRFSAYAKAINDTPDRNKAMEVFSQAMSSNLLRTPQQITAGLHMIDMRHPLKDLTPKEVTVYNKEKDITETKYLPAGDLTKINDPGFVEQTFGPQYSTQNPGKREEYVLPFQVDPSGFDTHDQPTFMGQHTEAGAPPGAVPASTYKLAEDFARGRRQEASQALAARREERLTTASEDANAARQASRKSLDQERLKNYVFAQTGGKLLSDGSFGFDTTNERELANARFKTANELYNKGMSWAEAAQKAVDQVKPPKDETKTAKEEPPKKQEAGWLQNFLNKLTGKGDQQGANLEGMAKQAWGAYEPDKYDYAVGDGSKELPIQGKLYRKPKGK